MEEFTVHGLVVNLIDQGDNDKLLTLLTEEKGKIFVSGKGVKSLKNKNLPSTQLFAYSNFVIKQKGNYCYIADSDLIESFYNIRNDIYKVSLAQYICDIASDISLEGSEDIELLSLTLNSLYLLSKDSSQSLSLIKSVYEFKAISLAGFQPNVFNCENCQKDAENIYYVDVMNGICYCENCFSTLNKLSNVDDGTAKIYTKLPFNVIQSLRYIIVSSTKKVFSFKLDDAGEKILSKFTETYLLNHLEHDFKTLKFYKSLFY